MKPTLYLETTVPSYYTARPSRDLLSSLRQQVTRLWWAEELPRFEVYVSTIVLEETRRGDQAQVQERMEVLSRFTVLRQTPEVERLAQRYQQELGLSPRAYGDAVHLAFGCAYQMEYLVTWNLAHLANETVRRHLLTINVSEGIHTPFICTPEELVDQEEDGNV
jgi:predicted nucleic acid-binding protein